MEEDKKIPQKVNMEVETKIQNLLEKGINEDNLDLLYKLVDIHKDIKNEEYWEVKKMNYREYNEGGYNEGGYGRRGVPGSGRGRYNEGSYNRRGVPGSGRGRYRGEEMMDEMMYHYGNYSEGKSMYGADHDTMKSFKYMLKSFKDYYKHLKQEASSQEEAELLEETAREMLEM